MLWYFYARLPFAQNFPRALQHCSTGQNEAKEDLDKVRVLCTNRPYRRQHISCRSRAVILRRHFSPLRAGRNAVSEGCHARAQRVVLSAKAASLICARDK